MTREKDASALPAGGGRLRRLLRIGRQRVDHLAGLGLVEFLPGFVLYGVGVRLEAVDVLAEMRVLLLKVPDLLLELLFLAALLIPGGEAMAAIDDAPGKGQGEDDCENGPGGAPALLQPEDCPLTKRNRLGGRFLLFH